MTMTVISTSAPAPTCPGQVPRAQHWRPCLFTLTLLSAVVLGLGYAVANWEWPAGAAQGSHFQGSRTADAPLPRRLKIGTFNIHGGYGADGRLDLRRTAAVMRGMDFIGLNEVRGAGWRDPRSQVEQLGSVLNLNWLFAPTETNWSGPHFGQGVLTRLPVSDWKRVPFQRVVGNGYRNYVECQIPIGQTPIGKENGRYLTILVTHLDRKTDRQDQLEVIIRRFLEVPPPVILMGDLNSKRTEPRLVSLAGTAGVIDCFGRFASGEIVRKRIDWMFVRGLQCVQANLEPTSSSDHPWGWAELELPDLAPVP